jgi:hypothetical protein
MRMPTQEPTKQPTRDWSGTQRLRLNQLRLPEIWVEIDQVYMGGD